MAYAGLDQQVEPGATVTLDGGASNDPNGDLLTYHWAQTGGVAVSFSPTLSKTTFTAPSSVGPLTFTLTVTDTGGLFATDTVVITVNSAPQPNAGPDQQVDPGETVTLDGSASSDPDGDPLVYHWDQTGGVAVSFSPDLMITTFTAPMSAGALTFALTVTDLQGVSRTDTTVVTVNNLGPTADAGPNLKVPSGAMVTLDGSASSDPNGDDLTYYWVQTGGTPISFNPNLSITTFTAPWGNNQLTFALTVTDTGGLSDSDSTKVTVGPVPTANAGQDQQVVPAVTVTLDGSASSDPDGNPLTYRWVQVGGVEVDFSSALSVTTFVAPSGQLTFTLIVTNTAGMTDTDTTRITAETMRIYLPIILTGSPQARLAPDQGGTKVLAGSNMTGRRQETGVMRLWRPIWPSGWIGTSPRSWAAGYQQLLGLPLPRGGAWAIRAGVLPRGLGKVMILI
jgi:hypothetical protein